MTGASIADAVKKNYVNDTWSFKRLPPICFFFFLSRYSLNDK